MNKKHCLQKARIVITISSLALLSGCGVSDLAHVGETPELSPIGNPADDHPGKITMPMPSTAKFLATR